MNQTGTFFMPPAISDMAGQVDRLFYFIYWVSLFFFVLIVGLMVVFIIRYRRRGPGDTTPTIRYNLPLEIVWTTVPLIILLVIFFWGFDVYMQLRIPPGNSIPIYVTARQWVWQFQYPNGRNSVNELVAPVGRPLKLIMTSKDVIHGFFVPDFRQKLDILPNRYTTTWLQMPQQPGEHDIFCSQYCGMSHSDMHAILKVVPEQDYQTYLESGGGEGKGLSLVEFGAMLYKSQACYTCHTVDGSRKIGPSFKGIFGTTSKFADGTQAVVDEDYIRESILVPLAKVVAGYQNVMPPFKGLLNDRQINALIEYVKSLK